MSNSRDISASIDSLLYHSPAIIFSLGLGPVIGITYISPNLKRILGHEPIDFTSNTDFWISQVHPEDQIKAKERFQELLISGSWAREYRFRHKDGTYRWMLDELKVVYDDYRVPVEIVGSWLDITTQVLERQEMSEKQRRAKEYIDHAPTLFLVLDTEGVVCDVNECTTSTLGYPASEMIGKNWFQHFLPASIRGEREWLFRSWIVNRQADEDSFDGFILTSSGEELVIRWKAVLVVDGNGSSHMVLAGEEITAKFLAQQSLQQSEELYRLMAFHSTDVIQKIDAQGIYTFVSPSSEAIMGFAPEELTGISMYDYLHPDDLNSLKQLHMQVLSGMHQSVVVTLRYRRKDGKYIWMESNVRIIFNEKGDVMEAVSVSRDITQRKYMERELEEMAQLMVAIHEKLSVISFRIGADGNIIRSVGKGLEKLGLAENQPFESNVFEMFPQLLDYMMPGTWKDYYTVETNGISSGKPWWFQHFYFRDINHDNELIGFAFDITDLKNTQAELYETKEMYRLLVNSFPDVAVFVFDKDLRFKFAEGQSLTENNWKSEDIVGRSLGEIFGNELTHPLYKAYKQSFEGVSKIFEYEVQGRIFQVQVIPIRDSFGTITWSISISQDITERKQLEQTILKVAIGGNDIERKELSEKLHDGLGQKIASIKLKLEQIDNELLATVPEQQEMLTMAKKSINLVLTSLRELSNLMMPNVLSDFGLQAALDELCVNVSRKGKLKIVFEDFELKQRPRPDVEMGLYRIAQELVNWFEDKEWPNELLIRLYEKSGHLILRTEQVNGVDNKSAEYFENTSEFYNITSRTRALNGHLEVKTLLDNRALIIVEVPIE